MMVRGKLYLVRSCPRVATLFSREVWSSRVLVASLKVHISGPVEVFPVVKDCRVA